jgi:hypothetical protein
MAENESRARAESAKIASDALRVPTLVDPVSSFFSQLTLRERFTFHGKVWSQFTQATLATDAAGATVGWGVDSRKDRLSALEMDQPAAEAIARAHPRISPRAPLTSFALADAAPGKRMAVLKFGAVGKAPAYEVIVSPTMKEIVSIMPAVAGELRPAPIDDDAARRAEALARAQVRDDLRTRVGPDTANNSDQIVRLKLERASADAAGGRRYEFSMWLFFSTCDVFIDQGQKETAGWHMPALANDSPESRITADDAVEFARPHLLAKEGVAGPRVEFSGEDEGKVVARVLWWHVERGLVVEDDHTTVSVNAWSGKVFAVARRWRAIAPALLDQTGISAQRALEIAEAERTASGVPAGARPDTPHKCIIETALSPIAGAHPVDAVVWLVGFHGPNSPAYTELAIEHVAGKVVRVSGW